MLAEYAARTLGGVDLLMRSAAAALERLPHPTAAQAADTLAPLATTLKTLPALRSFAVVDAAGSSVLAWPTSETWPPAIIRRVLEVHRSTPLGSPHIARVAPPGSGKPVILLSRRFEGPDGGFAGIVIAAVELDHLDRLHASFVNRGGALALRGDADELLVHEPDDDVLLAAEASRSVLTREADAGTLSIKIGRAWGGRTILSYRRVPGLPLTALSALDRDDAMADWNVVLRNHAATVGAVVFTLLGLTLLLLRQMARRQHVDDRLRAAIALPRHLVAVDTRDHRRGLSREIDQDGRGGTAVLGAVEDAGQHDQRRDRRDVEGERHQHRDRRHRPDAGQHADQGAHQRADEAVDQVLQRERDAKSEDQIVEEIHDDLLVRTP